MIRPARFTDRTAISKLLLEALNDSLEGDLKVRRHRLLAHVQDTIVSHSGFARVYEVDGEIVGCFMAALEPHAYVEGYIASELGTYIKPNHRGTRAFLQMLDEFVEWSQAMPGVLFTTFNIGQINEKTPALRRILESRGFALKHEGFCKT